VTASGKSLCIKYDLNAEYLIEVLQHATLPSCLECLWPRLSVRAVLRLVLLLTLIIMIEQPEDPALLSDLGHTPGPAWPHVQFNEEGGGGGGIYTFFVPPCVLMSKRPLPVTW
jgi:hypothetical protein